MENYPSFSYPDSGDSSPHSREPDFENPPPSWDDQQPQPQPHQNRVKFMVSYNGKIQPRSYDNLLSYVGGDTKILAVDRNLKFSALLSKLASLITSLPEQQSGATSVVTVKYQLPGEDLDALISVTNDDDLDHMMHEYDRLCKASSKPARLRLFLFSDRVFGSGFSSVSSEPGKVGPDNEPDRTPKFVDAFAAINQHHQEQQQQNQHQQVNYLNQNDVVLEPPMIASPPPPMPMPVHNNVDFLFGLDNKVPIPVQVPAQVPSPIPGHTEPDLVNEMNRIQISAQEFHHLQHQQQPSAVYSPTVDENLPPNISAAYWQQQQQQQQQQFLQQQVYMMHAPPQANVYPPPAVMQPPAISGQVQANQGYYQVQGMQPVYSMPPAMPAVSAAAGVRPGESAAGYAQVGYDTVTGRQFYYAAAPPPYSGMTAGATAVGVVGDGRNSGDGKVVQNVSPSSGGV
ncbi:uncharacterized protein LOC141611381 [Silene latifolia]|uniref:uncharacterized protein LOC141611381 n=1 Tax=Silene latifolia TaxID=37657 RepID=UPI003D7873D9